MVLHILTVGVSEVCNPTRQELLNRRLQGDDGTDDAFYSSPPSSTHRTTESSDFRCVHVHVRVSCIVDEDPGGTLSAHLLEMVQPSVGY